MHHRFNLIEFASRSLTQYLTREIAAGNNAWGGLYTALPNPDPVLRKTGQSISILDEIRRENHVASCSESREAAVTKKKWAVERVDATPLSAEVVEAVFKELPVRHIVRELCEAWGYGYQVSEIIWRREGNLLLPERVLGKPRPWFSFNKDGALCLRKSAGGVTGTPVEPYKFLLTQHRASSENPYGESKYSSCFWPVTFKRGGLKFWMVFLEKFGMPQLIGKTPCGTSEDERLKLLQALTGMVRDAVAVIPDDSSVEPLQVNVAGSSDVYAQFTAYHDSEISTAILGHSAAATSTPGKLGGEDLALQVRADIVENDGAMVEEAMNTLVKYIHELNPSLGSERPRFMLYDSKDIDKPRAERDALLLNTGKIRLTKKYFVEKYDFGEDEIEVVEEPSGAFGMSPGIDFSAHKPVQPHGGVAGAEPLSPKKDFDFQTAIDTFADCLPDDVLQTQVEGLLKPVLEAINDADSFEEVMAAANSLYDSMDAAAVEKAVEKAVLLGEVWGKISGEGAAQ